ncbi:MAG: hypothetical protein WBZ33_14790 [Thermoactinomyces sp.]
MNGQKSPFYTISGVLINQIFGSGRGIFESDLPLSPPQSKAPTAGGTRAIRSLVLS